MEAFLLHDRASNLQSLDLGQDNLPIQRSLGVYWDLKHDAFIFQVSLENKPFTRRGLLSTVNSFYDPLGFVAPVTLGGRYLLRKAMSQKCSSLDWDEQLTKDLLQEWAEWRSSLDALSLLYIPRTFFRNAISSDAGKELCTFMDTSEIAIAAVTYLKTFDENGKTLDASFFMGETKVAPIHATTIPRLELCAAVLGVELFEFIRRELYLKIATARFFSDSKVALGYITNTKRRFYVYVSNRVERIRQSTSSQQWNFIQTDLSPADVSTRPVAAQDLSHTTWLS